MHSNTPFLPHAVSLPHPFRSSSIDMGGVGGVQRREEEENANNAFFLFSPPPPPPKRRRRSSMSSSFGSNFATTSSSSNLSLMKLTPRTGICATALARMRYLSSLFVFFFSAIYASRRRFIEKFLLYKNRTSDPTPNTRRAVAKIHALQKAKGKEEKKTKMKTTSTTAATTTNTKNTNKYKE